MNNVKDTGYIKKFGVNLRVVRIKRGFTQEDLAYACDIPISQIGRIERGEINTTISTVKIIASALEIPIKDLFDFE